MSSIQKSLFRRQEGSSLLDLISDSKIDSLDKDVGQCGNQIGSVFWPLLLSEYGIKSNTASSLNTKSRILDKSFASFFNCPNGVPKSCSIFDLKKSNITARALLIDMEEKVVERFQRGGLHHLFDKKCSLTNHPGSANNWAMGHHSHYETHRADLEDMARRSSEQCDSLGGMLVLLSLGGGTGSGLGSAVVRLLEEQFPHVDRFVTCIHPGQYNDVITSPYNVALALRVLTEHATCVIPVDNKALTDICSRQKYNRGVKPFHDVNNIIVNMLANLTSGSRFSGSLNCDLSDLSTLVPQPGLQYLSASLSPPDATPALQPSFSNRRRDLLQEVCSPHNQLMRVNGLAGQLLSTALLCRGDIDLYTVRDYIHRFRSKTQFVAWGEPGIKAGLCSVAPAGHQAALLCLANSTNMAKFFSEALHHFNLLYRRKAHVHHYTDVEGFESEDFTLCQESLQESALKYSKAGVCLEVPRLVV